jgi:hypothetical protein
MKVLKKEFHHPPAGCEMKAKLHTPDRPSLFSPKNYNIRTKQFLHFADIKFRLPFWEV